VSDSNKQRRKYQDEDKIKRSSKERKCDNRKQRRGHKAEFGKPLSKEEVLEMYGDDA
jgi:hypothetical protein